MQRYIDTYVHAYSLPTSFDLCDKCEAPPFPDSTYAKVVFCIACQKLCTKSVKPPASSIPQFDLDPVVSHFLWDGRLVHPYIMAQAADMVMQDYKYLFLPCVPEEFPHTKVCGECADDKSIIVSTHDAMILPKLSRCIRCRKMCVVQQYYPTIFPNEPFETTRPTVANFITFAFVRKIELLLDFFGMYASMQENSRTAQNYCEHCRKDMVQLSYPSCFTPEHIAPHTCRKCGELI